MYLTHDSILVQADALNDLVRFLRRLELPALLVGARVSVFDLLVNVFCALLKLLKVLDDQAELAVLVPTLVVCRLQLDVEHAEVVILGRPV